jgi:hypothetical protein
LFGGESRAERGFVGMTIAGNYRQSVASPQTIRGWSGEAGVKYAF